MIFAGCKGSIRRYLQNSNCQELAKSNHGFQTDESVAVFTPLYINYGKNTKSEKTCL
jgi:hypothetical protein